MRQLRLKVALIPLTILLSILFICCEKEVNSEFSSSKISIGMVVSDLEKSLDFYTNVIGMRIVEEINIDTTFGRKSGLSDGKEFKIKLLKLIDIEDAPELKLMSFENLPISPSPIFIHDDTRIQYLTIFVKSMAPFLKRLKDNKIILLGESQVTLYDGRLFVCIQDPDGTFIELIGPK